MFHIDEFLVYLEKSRYSQSTRKSYFYLLSHFQRHCVENGISDVRSITEEHIQDFIRTWARKNWSEGYVIRQRNMLIRYFKFLEERGYIFLIPLQEQEIHQFQRHHYPALSEREVELILFGIHADRPITIKGKAIIALTYSSALRPREMYNLRLEDIDFKKGILFIRQSKNKKDRIVPVGTEALFWLDKYLKEVRPRYVKSSSQTWVFINHKTGERISRFGIRSAIQNTLRMSGLPLLKPYSLRSSAASALLLRGMSIAYIGELLGHESIRTTQIYLRVKSRELQKELTAKHPRNRFERQFPNEREEKEHEI